MSNKLLKDYFENTPQAKIKSDWDKYKKYDSTGITINDYLSTIDKLNSNWKESDKTLYKTPEIKLKSLEEAKTKVINKN